MSKEYVYTDVNGEELLKVVRYEIGEKFPDKKAFIQETKEKGEWVAKNKLALNPLYNLPEINSNLRATIVVVEGEKTAEAAKKLVAPRSNSFVVSCWAGGAQGWKKTDWSPLYKRNIILVPDNDTPGNTAMLSISAELTGKANVSILQLGKILQKEEKWDIADGGVSSEELLTLLTASIPIEQINLKECNDEEIGLNRDRKYMILGHKEGQYYFLSRDGGNIVSFSSQQLMSESAWGEIYADGTYWKRVSEKSNAGFGNKEKINVGFSLMKKCKEAGSYSPEKIRGRGVWLDEGRVVLHLGNKIYVNKKEVNPCDITSNFIYPNFPGFYKDDFDFNSELTDEESNKLLALARDMNFMERELSYRLYLGWLISAMVAGCLTWRAHVWISGEAGSGKTFYQDNITKFVLGDMAFNPYGSSSEAGLRQTLTADSRPVILDEAEQDEGNSKRRDAILEMIRVSSSGGEIIKGTSHHTSVSFTIRSMFCLSSIGVGLRKQSDETRFVLLDLITRKMGPEERIEFLQDSLKKLKSLQSVHNFSQKLLARLINHLDDFLNNVEVFKGAIASTVGNTRDGDQIGTLLAGYYFLESTHRYTLDEAINLVKCYDWSLFLGTGARTAIESWQSALNMIKDFDLTLPSGREKKRIGEMMMEHYKNPNLYGYELERVGIIYGGSDGWLFSTARDIFISKILKDNEWQRALRRASGAKNSLTYTFGTIQTSCIQIPHNVVFEC